MGPRPHRPQKHGREPYSSHMVDEYLIDALVAELAATAESFFSQTLPGLFDPTISYRDEISCFLKLYSNKPYGDNFGGSGFHNAFWIYLFARALNPRIIVESGVFKGHTTWLLETACPQADVVGFDIDLSQLEHKVGRATFFEHDWAIHQFSNVQGKHDLAFFDCHVNHAKRIVEASERGFKHLLFDDNPPLHKLYGYWRPGYPTANMLAGNDGLPNEEIRWKIKGSEIGFKIENMSEALTARKLIKQHVVFPDVGGPSLYGGFSFLSYVLID